MVCCAGCCATRGGRSGAPGGGGARTGKNRDTQSCISGCSILRFRIYGRPGLHCDVQLHKWPSICADRLCSCTNTGFSICTNVDSPRKNSKRRFSVKLRAGRNRYGFADLSFLQAERRKGAFGVILTTHLSATPCACPHHHPSGQGQGCRLPSHAQNFTLPEMSGTPLLIPCSTRSTYCYGAGPLKAVRQDHALCVGRDRPLHSRSSPAHLSLFAVAQLQGE